MTPDWAPSLHPLVVHFPIALLLAAALVDVVSLAVRRRHPAVRYTAVGLYVLAAVGALGTYLTGRSGIDAVDIPLAAVRAANNHADWALWLVWTAGLYAVLRLGVAFWKRSGSLAVHIPLLLLGLVPLFLVQQTAERGGRLVYLYGIGVRAATPENPMHHDHAAHGMGAGDHMSGDSAMAGMNHDMAGMNHDMTGMNHDIAGMNHDMTGMNHGATWEWTPGDAPLPAGTRIVEGDLAALAATRASGALVVRPQRPVLFVAGADAGEVEVEATLDLSQFTGIVMLVRHVHRGDAAERLGRAGTTVVYVVQGEGTEARPLGALGLADVVRPESKEAIDRLHALGLTAVMLTGDKQEVADHVARQLGIDRVIAEVLPDGAPRSGSSRPRATSWR